MTGRIVKALSGFYYVDTGEGAPIPCRGRGRLRHQRVSPLVGDRVDITVTGEGTGMVDAIQPRKNQFSRPAVANIDQMVMVCSGAIPVTDPYLIDRMTAMAEWKRCEPLILFNKCDLERADALAELYRSAGFPTLQVSAGTGEGVDSLAAAIAGKVSAFTGNSGVGKSSILNALQPGFRLDVGEVSEKLGRGRHTTRHVELFRLSCGAEVIDTPGFSSFDAAELDLELKERLPETFAEFRPYLGQCRFINCSHTKEKGCAVLAAVKAGEIPRRRHRNYSRLYDELKNIKAWDK